MHRNLVGLRTPLPFILFLCILYLAFILFPIPALFLINGTPNEPLINVEKASCPDFIAKGENKWFYNCVGKPLRTSPALQGITKTKLNLKSPGDLLEWRDQWVSRAIWYQRKVFWLGKQTGCAPKIIAAVCNNDQSCGGLGDRTRGLIIAFYQAWATDSIFLPAITKPVPLSLFFRNPVMTHRASDSLLSCKDLVRNSTSWVSMAGPVYQDYDYMVEWNDYQWVSVTSNSAPYTHIWRNPNLVPQLSRHGLECMPYRVAASVFFNIYFRHPTTLLQRLINPLLIAFGDKSEEKFTIGMQIRIGGNRPDFPDVHTFNDISVAIQFARKAIEICLGKRNIRYCQVFLTTDNPSTKMVMEDYLERISLNIESTEKIDNVEYADYHLEDFILRIVYYNSAIVHVDKIEGDTSVEAISKTYVDWYILAYYTDFLLTSASGYGISAVMANFTPHFVFNEKDGFIDSRICSEHQCQFLRGIWDD